MAEAEAAAGVARVVGAAELAGSAGAVDDVVAGDETVR